MNARIASLEAKENIIYAGLENGVILCIKCEDMCVSHTFSAYGKTVSSLMMLRPPNQDSDEPPENEHAGAQIRSTYHLAGQRKAPPKKLPLKPARKHSPITARRKFLIHSNSLNKQSFDLSPVSFKVSSSYKTAEDLLLISIGRGYRGIVGSCTNHPKEFILPSSTANELQSDNQTAKPNPEDSYLLIWSTEKCEGEEGKEREMTQDAFEVCSM